MTDATTALRGEIELPDPLPARVGGRDGKSRRRPPAVTILAIIELVSALVYGLLFLALLADDSATLEALSALGASGTGAVATVELAALRIIVGSFCVAALAGGVLLLRMRRLGWTIAMLLTGVGLAASIVTWMTQGSALSVWLLVQVVTVFYLNQRQVRHAFGITRRSAGNALEVPRG